MINSIKREQNKLEVALNKGLSNGTKVVVDIDLSKNDTAKQQTGAKTSSHTKKTIAHRIEALETMYANTIDKRPNGFVKSKKLIKKLKNK